MKYLPNVLTIFRIVATPFVLLLLLTDYFFEDRLWARLLALALFVFAAISDYWDGRLARTYGLRSRLGQFLDPLADKVLVLGTFVALALLLPDIVPWWAVGLIAFRDVMVTGLRSWAEAKGKTIHTSGLAKTKTTFQLTFIIATLLLLTLRLLPAPLEAVAAFADWFFETPFLYWLLVLVVFVTVLTGVLYFTKMEYTPSSEFDS